MRTSSRAATRQVFSRSSESRFSLPVSLMMIAKVFVFWRLLDCDPPRGVRQGLSVAASLRANLQSAYTSGNLDPEAFSTPGLDFLITENGRRYQSVSQGM